MSALCISTYDKQDGSVLEERAEASNEWDEKDDGRRRDNEIAWCSDQLGAHHPWDELNLVDRQVDAYRDHGTAQQLNTQCNSMSHHGPGLTGLPVTRNTVSTTPQPSIFCLSISSVDAE